MAQLTAPELLLVGREKLAALLPYYSPLVYRMEPIVKHIKGFTCAVDAQARLYWNPDFLMKHPLDWEGQLILVPANGTLECRVQEKRPQRKDASGALLFAPMTPLQVAFVLGHELLHLSENHNQRRDELKADAYLWNLAADYLVNTCLQQTGMPPLPGSVTQESVPKHVGAHLETFVEGVYHRFLQWIQPPSAPPPPFQSGQGQGQAPRGGGTGQAGGSQAGKGQSTGPTTPLDQSPAQRGVAQGHCGGCVGRPTDHEDDPQEAGEKRPASLPVESQAGPGEDSSQPGGASSGELNKLRAACAEKLKAHIPGGGRGHIPGSWVAWMNALLTPAVISWQEVLRQFSRNARSFVPGVSRPQWDRPHRRQGARGYGPDTPLLPRRVTPKPRFLLAIDTSGSMSNHQLSRCASEVQDILQETKAPMKLVICDAAIQATREVRTIEEVCQVLGSGRGGTDFRPVFEYVEELPRKERPTAVFFLTDGFGPAPEYPPTGVEVFWILIGTECRAPVAWGESITIPTEDI